MTKKQQLQNKQHDHCEGRSFSCALLMVSSGRGSETLKAAEAANSTIEILSWKIVTLNLVGWTLKYVCFAMVTLTCFAQCVINKENVVQQNCSPKLPTFKTA